MSTRKTTMLRWSLAACVLLGVSTSRLAHAQNDAGDTEPSQYSYETGGMFGAGVVTGLKLGGGFGAPFNQMDPGFVGELELGYNLPFMQRALGVFLSGQYTNPSMEQKGIEDRYGADAEDPSRVPGDVSYTLAQQQALLTLGLLYRVPLQIPMFRPYVAAGGRYVMMSTEVQSQAGTESFGTNTETADTFGLYGGLGGELYLGPGAVLLELQWSRVRADDQYVLRNTNVSSLNVALGYRLFL